MAKKTTKRTVKRSAVTKVKAIKRKKPVAKKAKTATKKTVAPSFMTQVKKADAVRVTKDSIVLMKATKRYKKTPSNMAKLRSVAR